MAFQQLHDLQSISSVRVVQPEVWLGSLDPAAGYPVFCPALRWEADFGPPRLVLWPFPSQVQAGRVRFVFDNDALKAVQGNMLKQYTRH